MAFLRVAVRSSVSNKFGSRHLLKYFPKSRSSVAVETTAPYACKSTHATGAIGLDSTLDKTESRRDKLDLAFEDTVAAFKSKTNWEIFRAYIVYTICSSSYVVENNMKLMRLAQAILGKRLFTMAMKATFYGHFVAGEDQEKVKPTLERLRSFGVKPILDYSVEEDLSSEEAERREFESCVSEAGDEQSQGETNELIKKNILDFGARTVGTNDYACVFSTPEFHQTTQVHKMHDKLYESISLKSVIEEPIINYESVKVFDLPKKLDSPNLNQKMKNSTIKRYHVHREFADRRYKVEGARTYFYLNEAQCERNLEVFQRCLEATSGSTYGTGFTAIKLTALGRPQLLLQLSEVIMRTHQYFSEMTGEKGPVKNVLQKHIHPEDLQKKFEQAHILGEAPVKKFLDKITYDSDGVIHLFPWSGIIDENAQLSETFRVPDLKTGRMVRLITQLTPKEEEMFRNMIRRLDTICKLAKDLDVRMMIDAEQTYFQPAISRITLEMMRKYNKEKGIIFNTYQCYLKDTFDNITIDLEQSARQNFVFSAKLVRGAYLEQERARAAALGYEDPTNPSFEATTEMFHKTLTECLRRIKDLKDKGLERRIAVMVASHNEDTVRFAIDKMNELGFTPQEKVLCFGQLLGMCDYITFPLGQSGYSAYKYIPYGPVDEVLPYLSRRAQENKGILKKIKKEKRLLLTELRNRILRGKIFYRPKGDYVPV